MRTLGTDPSPGFYKHRHLRKSAYRPVMVQVDIEGLWHVLLSGEPVANSPNINPYEISFLLHNWPMLPIEEAEYWRMRSLADAAPADHPLKTGAPINLREMKPI